MSTQLEPAEPSSRSVTPSGGNDLRESLANDRAVGPVAQIQLPLVRTTRLHAVMLDLDPKLYRPGNLLFPPRGDPREFYQGICPVLRRHPLACHAEVRVSGTGLHLLIRIDPPVEL